MKNIRIPFTLSILLIATVFLSACSGNLMAASSWPGLTIDQDTAYLAYNQFIFAINLESGALKWRYPGDKPDPKISFYAAPALTEEKELILAGYDHKLYKLDARNGSFLWSYEGAKNRYVASPLVTAAGIFAPNTDGSIYALDFNKNALWKPFPTRQALWAKPATNEACDCIFLPSMDHHLYAIDAQTGELEWQSQDLGGALVAEPTFGEDGTIYIGTFGNEMLAIDATTQEIKWRYATDGWVWSGARLADGKLYFGDLKGNFYALSTSGEEIWKIQPDGPVVGTPVVSQDRIYFGTEEGTLYAYQLDGTPVWNQKIDGKLYSPPVASGDLILITPTESETILVALTSNGVIKWSYIPSE